LRIFTSGTASDLRWWSYAQQQGIQGTVQVVVSLDADSKVVGTRIQASPSAILNGAALSAARQSTFQTEIRDCKPIATDLVSASISRRNNDKFGRRVGRRPSVVLSFRRETGW
jgi:hypothetical protein